LFTNVNIYNVNENVGNGLGGWVHMSVLWVGLGQKAGGMGRVGRRTSSSAVAKKPRVLRVSQELA